MEEKKNKNIISKDSEIINTPIEDYLIDSEARYKTLIELSPDAIFVHNDDEIIFTNDKGAKILGFQYPTEVYGKRIWEFTPKDERKDALDTIDLAKKDNITIPLREQKIIRIDGNIIDVEISTTPIPFDGKNCILNIMRDITGRKQMQKQLKEILLANEELLGKVIEYDKLKTDFFSNISHEFKTPLNIILGGIQLIINSHDTINCENFNMLYKYATMIKQNCYRLLRLINNLIDITRIDSKYLDLDIKNYNIVSVVEDITLSVAEYLSSKEIDLIFDTNIEEKIIACDADKIERIMLNLLSNATKFTEPKGSILVSIYGGQDKVRISVKDTGAGIAKEKQRIIFDRFRQADSLMTRKNEGSGIGLALVKSLVDAHGGTIRVESEIGKGSEFIIELPTKSIDLDDIVQDQVATTSEPNVERIHIEFSDIYS